MIDDLVTLGATEPYRMFTSRVEHRLHLRPDNADIRLVRKGVEVGCISESRASSTLELELRLKETIQRLKTIEMDAADWSDKTGQPIRMKGMRNACEILECNEVSAIDLSKALPNEIAGIFNVNSAPNYPGSFGDRIKYECHYSKIVAKQKRKIEELRRNENLKIPDDINYDSLEQLSLEAREKLSFVRPRNMAQASRIEGVTHSGLMYLMGLVKNRTRR